MCSGATRSQCRFRHCRSSTHATGAAWSILCEGNCSEVVWVISQWSNTDLPGQGSTITPSHSRLQCATGIGTGTTEIQRLYWRSGKPHWRPSSGSSHVSGRHSTYRVYNGSSDNPNAIMKLQNCVESIHQWCASRRMQLNPAKTELIEWSKQPCIHGHRIICLATPHANIDAVSYVTSYSHAMKS